jgi:hypothetical protein
MKNTVSRNEKRLLENYFQVLPASSLDCERSFSKLRHIFSDDREWESLSSDSIFANCIANSILDAKL